LKNIYSTGNAEPISAGGSEHSQLMLINAPDAPHVPPNVR